MERITLYLRTTNTSGKIKLRFRLTEGREVQLFHKSQIDTDLADLRKFEMDGSLKPRVSIYNKKLRIAITDDGILYVQYLPKKTMRTQNDRREKKTPLMLFALEIVKRSGFKFGVLKYASGKSGYNAKIKNCLNTARLNDWLVSMTK